MRFSVENWLKDDVVAIFGKCCRLHPQVVTRGTPAQLRLSLYGNCPAKVVVGGNSS